jgi:hypothetical protein
MHLDASGTFVAIRFLPFYPQYQVTSYSFSPLIHCYVQCFVRATDSTASVLNHTCHCSGVILLINACARRVKESELGLGVREDEDVDGYAIKTILHPIFLMTKLLQLLVYCPPRSLIPSPAPLVLRSCIPPTPTLHRHLAEKWMTTPFPNIQNAA